MSDYLRDPHALPMEDPGTEGRKSRTLPIRVGLRPGKLIQLWFKNGSLEGPPLVRFFFEFTKKDSGTF